MPYISPDERNKFKTIDLLFPATKGELEYCIFTLMVRYKNRHTFNYEQLHDITYSAQHCADEFRRRFLDKREDEARIQNGDI
ncbi:MAG: DUF6899 family protein [Planctomycetota bacterium]|jgi:hypothetical protein